VAANPYSDCAAGYIRYVLDYHRFTHRHEPPQDGVVHLGSHIAAACGHELHLADSRTLGYCPVCEVEMSLEFLDAIAKAWGDAGGPRHNLDLNKNRNHPLGSAWHLAWLQHEQLLSPVEAVIEHEAASVTPRPARAAAGSNINTSAKATMIAHMECKYPAAISKTTTAAKKQGVKRKVGKKPPKKTKKTVSFATDTNFDPGRPCEEFKRTSGVYEPGIHAWVPNPNPDSNVEPGGEGWADTSHFVYHITTDTINLNITTSGHVFAQVREENYVRLGIMRGLVGQCPGCAYITKCRKVWHEQKDNDEKEEEGPGTRGTLELKMLIQISDALIVWTSDQGEVMDIIFSRCEDVEDEHYGDKDQVIQSRWTCLRDCIDGPGVSRSNLATMDDIIEEPKDEFFKRCRAGGMFKFMYKLY
jgi:hypothetical protein